MSDSTHEGASEVARERPELLIFCGLAGIVGNLAPLVTITIATLVTQHDFIADTISELAQGDKKWIMDTGFYVNAAGLLGLTIGAAHAHLGRIGWSLGIFCLAFLALVITLLGVWDEFHTAGNNPPGMTVHTELTFFLGPLFLAGPLLMAKSAAKIRPLYGWLFVAAAILWAVFAAWFKFAPNSYDGILEKIAVAATLLWVMPLALIFLRRGYDKSDRLTG